MNIRYITWEEFDRALNWFPAPICDSFYPIPRGGMVLAVALSHRFGKPIVDRPTKMSILVDDIADSGKTLNSIRLRYPYPAFVLARRYTCKQNAITAALEIDNDDWLCFPWENKSKVEADYHKYKCGK